jgi:hypothetical protein
VIEEEKPTMEKVRVGSQDISGEAKTGCNARSGAK